MTKQGLNAKSSELKLRTFSSFSYSRLEKRQPEHLLYKRPSRAQWEKHVAMVSEGRFEFVVVVVAIASTAIQLSALHEE